MFSFDQLEVLEIELTSNCQASCPMCARNYHGGVTNPNIKIEEWSLEEFKTIIDVEVLNQIKKIIFCGSFGDPILNNNLIDICCYIKENNYLGEIRIHTNGSARDESWWQSLANSLPKKHYVTFGIDGLEDTHHLYRIGTNFNKIIKNASAFINAGGRAEWAFIKFKHNQHQVEEAEELAKTLNFKKFSVKASSRFIEEKFPVLNKHKEVLYNLEPASTNTIKFFNKNDIINYKKIVEESSITCQAKHGKELYLDYSKSAFPCCYTASAPYLYNLNDEDIYPLKVQSREEINKIIEQLGCIKINKRSIKDLLNSLEWTSVWNHNILNTKPLVCVKNCGHTADKKPITEDQYLKQINL